MHITHKVILDTGLCRPQSKVIQLDILDNFLIPTLGEQFGDGPSLFQHEFGVEDVQLLSELKTLL